MDIEGIRRAVRKEPFFPFELKLADGRTFEVKHPEYLAVGKRRIIVVHEDDSWSIVEPLLVTSLDYSAEAPVDDESRPRENNGL